jgi:hypothetical protein
LARTQIPVTAVVKAGVAQPSQTSSDFTNGMYFINDGATFLEIVSTDAGTQTVVIQTGKTVDGYALADQTITLLTGAAKVVGPFTTGTFNQPAASTQVYVDPSINTTLKFRAYSVSG